MPEKKCSECPKKLKPVSDLKCFGAKNECKYFFIIFGV